MKILLLTQFYPPVIGGEELHVRNLGAALSRRGHKVTVATLQPGTAAPRTERDGDVRVVRLPGALQRIGALYSDPGRRHAPPFPDPELTWRLGRLLAEERPDVVHAHNWILHSFLPVRRATTASFVVTLHDYSLVCVKKTSMRGDLPCDGAALSKCVPCAAGHYGAITGPVTAAGHWLSSRVERRVVDRFVAVSQAVAHLNGLSEAGLPFEVIPNFVPDSIDAVEDDRTAALPEKGYILFVGDLRELKGIKVIVEAYRRLRNAPPLVLVGRDCPDTPRDLPPGVHLFRNWPHTAVARAWQRCLFGVAPSIWPEPCATVVLEAMAFGKPMIATAVGGMPDMIDDGETGLLVAPGDAGQLAAAMQSLVDDADKRARLGQAGLQKVQGFTASAVAARLEDLYRSLREDRDPVVPAALP